jgi:hypothetical protein
MNDENLNDISIKQFESFLSEELGLMIGPKFEKPLIGTNYKIDCSIILQLGKSEVPMFIEVKGQISTLKQIEKFEALVKPLNGIGIIIADLIEPKIKEHLKKNGIGYFDMSKDLFLPLNFKLEPEYIDKKIFNENMIKRKGFKAESNLKLLLYLISKPEALSFTQRQLSQLLDLSLGAINKSFTNLDKVNLVLSRGSKHYLGQFEEIVTRFRISFMDFEERKMSLGRFSPTNDEFYNTWMNKDLSKINSFWGGEAAAAIRTSYLSPEIFRIYTYSDQAIPLLKELRLKKDPNGKIEILKAFWPSDVNNQDGTIPDFLTYCDLLNSGIDRNIETAKILEEKIKKEIVKYVY